LWSVRFFFLDDITGFEITYLLEVCSELQTGHLGVIWFQNVIASDSSCIFKILSFITSTSYFLLNLKKQFICTPLDFLYLVAGKMIFCRVNIREQSTNQLQFDGKKNQYIIFYYKVQRNAIIVHRFAKLIQLYWKRYYNSCYYKSITDINILDCWVQLPEPFSFIFTWFAAVPLIVYLALSLTRAIIKDFVILKVWIILTLFYRSY
jgi:hypothetical protein